MARKNKNIILCMVFIVSLTFAFASMYTYVKAQDDSFDFGSSDFGSDDSSGFGSDSFSGGSPDMMVQDSVEKPAQYFDDDPKKDSIHKDPFASLVEKPKPKMPVAIPQAPDIQNRPINTAPIIPPLNIKVMGLVTSGKKKLALITLDGQFMSMFEGDSVPNKFKLVEINEDSITVYENQRQSRRNIQIGE